MFLANLKPGINPTEFFIQQKSQNPKYGKEILFTILNHLVKIGVDAAACESEKLDQSNKDLLQVYLDQAQRSLAMVLFRNWTLDEITPETRQQRYQQIVKNTEDPMSDQVKIKGIILAVESQEIAETIKKNLTNMISNNSPWDEIMKTFEKFISEYSVYVRNDNLADSRFDDRIRKVVKQCGVLQDIVTKAEDIKPQSIYSSSIGNGDTKLHFLVCVSEVYRHDVSLSEISQEIDNMVSKELQDSAMKASLISTSVEKYSPGIQ
jgi:hypothetical protein